MAVNTKPKVIAKFAVSVDGVDYRWDAARCVWGPKPPDIRHYMRVNVPSKEVCWYHWTGDSTSPPHSAEWIEVVW